MKFEQNWLSSFRGGVLRETTRQTDDRQKVITLAHPEYSSDELKTLSCLSGTRIKGK